MAAPKLRFKEFDGDWTSSDFSKASVQIIDGDRGFNYPKSDDFYDDEFCLFLNAGNVTKQGFNFENTQFITKNKDSSLRKGKLERNDLVITTRGTVGNVAYFNDSVSFKNMRINSGMVIARCQKNVLADFINQFLNSDLFEKWLDKNAFGSAQPQLTVKLLNSIDLNYPSKPEQTKIASFLSAVDEKISQLTQKHELLSQYKQGMMQKLFSQQIRFKADDGSEFGEWEEKTLIDSVDTNIKWSFTGGPFGSNLKSEDYTELGIRIIQLQNIGDGAFLNDYKIYTSPEKANELLSCNIYPDEILISKMGDPVARCCIVPKHHDRYVMCSDGIRLVVDKQNYSSIFMFYQINYQDFRQSASDVSTGSTRKRIGLSDLKQLPIKVPCLEEQTKIANFLSAIDQKIEVVAQQIEQAKTWKKGLLQQMFV